MAPNSGTTSTGTSLQGSAAEAAKEDGNESLSSSSSSLIGLRRQPPRNHPEEPLLHLLPEDVYPEYRSLPLPVRLVVLGLSMWTSAVTTWQRLTWLQPLAILQGWRAVPSIAQVLSFAAKTLALSVFSQMMLQDVFLPPSRLSMNTLLQQYFLPSSLSKYESIPIPQVVNDDTDASLGVHFLQYPHTGNSLDAVYVNHGFGASSLSWLPALPRLVRRLGAKVGLGHDMAGFGFTERPEDTVEWYTTQASAKIGAQLLLLSISSQKQTPSTPKSSSVALFGHSLGSITTLKMALQLPRETTKYIILIAPALGLRKSDSSNKNNHSNSKSPSSSSALKPPSLFRRKLLRPITSGLRKTIVYPVSVYILRRVVGATNFWKTGLQSVWGDAQKLRDSDVLRFQWPSVGAGWERGLLHFVRAQGRTMGTGNVGGGGGGGEPNDGTLLRRVLALPHTHVAVILGSNDKVISSKRIRKFLQEFDEQQQVPIVELEGLGHDAFEEDVDIFVDTVDDLFQSWKKKPTT